MAFAHTPAANCPFSLVPSVDLHKCDCDNYWMFRFCKRLSLLAIVVATMCAGAAAQAEAPQKDGSLYLEHVQPILRQHCYECHSGDTQEGGLRVDHPTFLKSGGDTGTAFVPGKSAESLLIQAVRQTGDVIMPPKGKLTNAEIDVLQQWIDQGGEYPADLPVPRSGIELRLEQASNHWAFQPLKHSERPAIKQVDWPRNEIDFYVLARLEQAGLTPSPEADRAKLIRRLTLDLIGLPPTPEEVASFVADEFPQAYETLVDRLLASPHYGERWGRHWLDLARYADSSGFHNDLDRPWAWKYRDYVIQSFNEDKPYARFVAEQLAGDEVDDANETSLIATGFCRNGPSNDDNMGKTEAALKQYRADQLDDVISTTSTVFLGITLGCARCHDHKVDPFTARDYYSLLAIFNGTDKYGLVPGTEDSKGKKVEEGTKVEIQGLVETSSQVPTTHVMRRGIATNLGEEVGPAVPAALVASPINFPEAPPESKSSLRRRTLAEWITSADNSLAWRVLANRIWQHHFGAGLVASPSNLGFAGSPPTHPELLDYLAQQLIQNGGHWKPLHKQIVMSATYRQSSSTRPEGLALDPDNRWLCRMNLRRMEAEVLRDSILAVSGKLNLQAGGPGIKPRLPADLIPASQRNKWPNLKEEDARHWRRSVYIYSKRQLLLPMMELFDAPSTTDSCPQRVESIVPTQALILMNDDFVESQAEFTARRVLKESHEDVLLAVQRLFELAVGHGPTEVQCEQALNFVEAHSQQGDTQGALIDLAHVLFNSSEFLYIQ